MSQSKGSRFVPRLRLERSGARPLWIQIADGVREELDARGPAFGTLLPSSRELARMLGVARGTVLAALDQLVAEGYLTARRGAGYLVARRPGTDPPAGKRRDSGRSTGSPVRRCPAATLFRPGMPDMRLFPRLEWSRCMPRVWRSRDAWESAPCDPFGDEGLRRAIAEHLVVWRSIRASWRQIAITAGSIGGLELLFRAILRGPDRIAVEEPGYPVIRHVSEGFGHQVCGVPVDADGIRADALRALDPPPRLAVVTPSRQFPLGHVLATERRRILLEWAEAADAFLVEDDYDSEYRYGGRPVPALAAMDGGRRVIYAGTFSKIFSTGIRIGYLVLPEALCDPVRAALGRFGTRASLVPQPALARFIEKGAFARHVRRTRRIYAARRNFLLAGIRTRLGDLLRPGDASGGMSLAVFLNAPRSPTEDAALVRGARRAGLGIAALSGFFSGSPTATGFLLGFAAHTEPELARGLDRLADLLSGCRRLAS